VRRAFQRASPVSEFQIERFQNHQLLPYGRENATGTFRKSLIALSLTDRTIMTRVNFVESERKAAISQWITDIVLSYRAKEC
jgi:hypothetical protein